MAVRLPAPTVGPTAGPLDAFDDESLVARLRLCDLDALAALYDRHADRAFDLAMRIADDELVAERAIQRAFLIAWRSGGAVLTGARPGHALLSLVQRQTVALLERGEHPEARPAPAQGVPSNRRPVAFVRRRILTGLTALRHLLADPEPGREDSSRSRSTA